ncbi:dynamin-related protein 3A-like isoform X2 [Impatiens glandulifera]|uniref:dynamin-related protein 3A-like isoform X2 n=1 Tax=Impatiens glandulifera TaxID=253017 RepID=UPI001FB054E8|nr:dynamin-related protein 3A-like isoform X2 [Impatiens glandulifera]
MADDMLSTPPQASSSPPRTAPLGSSLIPIANKLQDIFAQLGSQSTIELPQVAVVGSQSSGKSSVLEALVGRDFLPRGSGICTRRPLVLQLLQTKSKQDGTEEEYGEFLHLPGKRFTDFNEIRSEIQAETERGAGGNKGVSDKQIRLKIFSPNVLDITLVDLPGITKVPVGDQPSNIEALIRTMIMSYIKCPTCLILAVTPANADLANSDALQIAGNADPNGERTIGVITKLDIMDRGTDARNFLLGKVIPLRLGYVGVVNRSQQVYSDIADRCGVPQLAKKLNQVLIQQIKRVLPELRSRISAELVSVAKEHASYGEITESKAGQGALLLNFLSKYCEAFSSMIEGKNEEMSTTELSGGARIHYIFQSIFVKSLEEVDPCEDLTDDDIRTAIQNATGPRSALFVPEVPFGVLVRRQIARLLDPSLQCARFIYDELVKMSHRCMINELQRFPVLRRRMDEVIGDFLREGLEPSKTMIRRLIEMEMDYINTSHPNFVGGSKAVEMALQQARSNRTTPIPKPKDGVDSEKAPASERTLKSRLLLPRTANGINPDQASRPVADEKPLSGSSTSWGIPSIFGGSDNRTSSKDNVAIKAFSEPVQFIEHSVSLIQLREPPAILRPSETHSDQETVEIIVTKLLLRSYYDIVRKNVEDYIPKAIIHFLVNHTKRELHNVLIKMLYRDDLFEKMLQEPDEVAEKRKNTSEKLSVLQQAFRILDKIPLDAETVERGYSLKNDPTGLPKVQGLPSSSLYSTESYSPSRKSSSKSRKSSHSGEMNNYRDYNNGNGSILDS